MIIIEEFESDCLQISLDIVLVTKDNELSEAINVKDNVNEIVKNITNIINDFGYEELEPGRPSSNSYSNSLYFTFCDKEDYDLEEVELIIGMRVSDHDLPKWDNDRTSQDTKNRQLDYLSNFTKNYYMLNKHLKNGDTIPVDYIYVKYENEFYSDLDDLYNKVKEKLQAFKNKHK